MAKHKKTKQPAAAAGAKNGTCFVIMPFDNWSNSYYEDIFTPAIEDAGLTPRRADDLYRPSAIVHDIWNLTKTSKLMLADLTGKNPNVFYELGLAHAIAKPVILVAETIDDVPFDLRALRVLIYNKSDPQWGTRLKESITTAAKEVLAAPRDAVLPSFLTTKDRPNQPAVTATEKALIAMRQDIDMLKRAALSRDDNFMSLSDIVEGIPLASMRRKGNVHAYHPAMTASDIISNDQAQLSTEGALELIKKLRNLISSDVPNTKEPMKPQP